MRIEVAVALIPVLVALSVDNRKLLRASLASSGPVHDKFADRLPETVAVLDFLDVIEAVTLPPIA